MNDVHNPDEVSINLQYADRSNECGWSMINNLLTHGFQWKNNECGWSVINNLLTQGFKWKNNECGWSMINNLLTQGFKWKNGEDCTTEKVDKLVKKDKRGYILEVDVEYPKELRKNH